MDPETLFIALRKNAALVLMHVVLGTIIGLVVGILTPATYTSSANANLSVEQPGSDSSNPTAQLNYLTSLMPTLVEIATSESTLNEVSQATGISQAELRKSVKVTSKTETIIVQVSATSTDPARAHQIVEAEMAALDSVARSLSNSGQSNSDLTVTLVVRDSPSTPTAPSSLSNLSTSLIGAVIGLAAGVVMALLLYFLSRRNPHDNTVDPLVIIGRHRPPKNP